MIVVDTNVIVALWLPTSMSALAERVLARDPAWAAPLLWRSEFRSVLTGYVRRGALDLTHATRIAEDAEGHLHSRAYDVASAEVLRWTLRSRCSAYDCEFVALAAELETTLVTSDRAVLRAYPQIARAPFDEKPRAGPSGPQRSARGRRAAAQRPPPISRAIVNSSSVTYPASPWCQ